MQVHVYSAFIQLWLSAIVLSPTIYFSANVIPKVISVIPTVYCFAMVFFLLYIALQFCLPTVYYLPSNRILLTVSVFVSATTTSTVHVYCLCNSTHFKYSVYWNRKGVMKGDNSQVVSPGVEQVGAVCVDLQLGQFRRPVVDYSRVGAVTRNCLKTQHLVVWVLADNTKQSVRVHWCVWIRNLWKTLFWPRFCLTDVI